MERVKLIQFDPPLSVISVWMVGPVEWRMGGLDFWRALPKSRLIHRLDRPPAFPSLARIMIPYSWRHLHTDGEREREWELIKLDQFLAAIRVWMVGPGKWRMGGPRFLGDPTKVAVSPSTHQRALFSNIIADNTTFPTPFTHTPREK